MIRVITKGQNYISGDLQVQDLIGSGFGFTAKFDANSSTGSIERYIADQQNLFQKYKLLIEYICRIHILQHREGLDVFLLFVYFIF
jgi:hypothetical protein